MHARTLNRAGMLQEMVAPLRPAIIAATTYPRVKEREMKASFLLVIAAAPVVVPVLVRLHQMTEVFRRDIFLAQTITRVKMPEERVQPELVPTPVMNFNLART